MERKFAIEIVTTSELAGMELASVLYDLQKELSDLGKGVLNDLAVGRSIVIRASCRTYMPHVGYRSRAYDVHITRER